MPTRVDVSLNPNTIKKTDHKLNYTNLILHVHNKL